MGNTNTELETIISNKIKCIKKYQERTKSALAVQNLEEAEQYAQTASKKYLEIAQITHKPTTDKSQKEKIIELANQAKENAIEAHRLIAEFAEKNTWRSLNTENLEQAQKFARKASDHAFKASQLADDSVQEKKSNQTEEALKKVQQLAEKARQHAIEAHDSIAARERPIQLRNIFNIINAFLKSTPVIGFSLLFIYFFKIDYFPKGLSVSDSLLIIFLAIFYGIIYLFSLAPLIFSYFLTTTYLIPLISRCRCRCKDYKCINSIINITIYVVVIIITIYICAIVINCFITNSFTTAPELILNELSILLVPAFSIVAVALILHIITSKTVQLQNKLIGFLGIFFYIIVFFIMGFLHTNSIIFNFTIQKLNFAQNNATLLVSESACQSMQNIADAGKLNFPYICREGGTLIHDVKILWNNLGENIYIELSYNSKLPDNPTKKFRMELKQSDVKMIKLEAGW